MYASPRGYHRPILVLHHNIQVRSFMFNILLMLRWWQKSLMTLSPEHGHRIPSTFQFLDIGDSAISRVCIIPSLPPAQNSVIGNSLSYRLFWRICSFTFKKVFMTFIIVTVIPCINLSIYLPTSSLTHLSPFL